jgi:hypothetical protein
MANSCWNSFSFFGNRKVMEQADLWIKALDLICRSENINYLEATQKIFYANDKGEYNTLDMEWINPDPTFDTPKEIGLISLWGPPNAFQDYITLILFKFDHKVVVRNYFRTEANQLGVRYTTPEDAESVYTQSAEVNVGDLDANISTDQIFDNLGELLEAKEKEIIEYLIDDMPGRAKKLKKSFMYLEIDWDDYE